MRDLEQERAAAEWTAWHVRPIAERQAIQDKVHATIKAHGIQAGRDMMKAPGMPIPPAVLITLAAVLEAQHRAGHERGDGLWEPVGRVDH